MAGTILTPAAIWRDFNLDGVPTAEIISQTKSGNLNYTEMYIEGRTVKDGTVKIYAKLAKAKTVESAPAIILLGDFNRSIKFEQDDLAKKGYIVLAVDIAGDNGDAEHFTHYPESISYANYALAKDSLYQIQGNIDSTCWYEWAVTVRYALAYLKGLECVTKVGGLAVGEACTVLWQVAGTDRSLDCACFALNAGWNGYRGTYKFGGAIEQNFTNELYKFIAGVEPQSYAMHVECPVLMLSATNSDVYDVDRAYDTVSRIGEQYYRAVHYSVGHYSSISEGGYQDALIFFENTMMKKGKLALPKEMDIKCDVVDGALNIVVNPDKKDIESLAIYTSEQTVRPALRAWRKCDEVKEITKKGEYVFEYAPYPESGMVTLFAKAKYKSGFSLCSTIISKKFSPEEIKVGYKSNIIYSSRLPLAQSVFAISCDNCNECEQIFVSDKRAVKVKKGAKGIEGVCRECGLVTFKINSIKDKPKQDAILMFDAHAKTDTDVTVKLISDYFGNRTEYLATVRVYGGQIWHNVKLSRNKFKTVEGMPLRSYDQIDAIAFYAEEGEFLLNNALWV